MMRSDIKARWAMSNEPGYREELHVRYQLVVALQGEIEDLARLGDE